MCGGASLPHSPSLWILESARRPRSREALSMTQWPTGPLARLDLFQLSLWPGLGAAQPPVMDSHPHVPPVPQITKPSLCPTERQLLRPHAGLVPVQRWSLAMNLGVLLLLNLPSPSLYPEFSQSLFPNEAYRKKKKKKLFLVVVVVWLGDHTQWCPDLTPGSTVRNHFRHMGCWGLERGQMCTRQMS